MRTALLALAALALPARADFRVLHWASPQPDGPEVQVNSCLDRTPHRGFLPVTVTLRNGLDRDQAWTLTFRSGHRPSNGDSLVESIFPLIAPARSATRQQILVPLPTQFQRGRGTTLQASLTGGRTSASGFLKAHDHNTWTTLALAQSLGSPETLEKLGAQIRSRVTQVRSTEPVAILLDPGSLPPDWRALSGIDALILATPDWRLLSPAVRAAIRDWVRLGHHLLVVDPAGTAPPALELDAAGFGTVEVLQGDGRNLPAAEIQARLAKLSCDRLQNLRDDFDRGWPLQNLFGFRSFNPFFVFLLLIAFAILVGPVNLFAWADAQHRFRLIFTVPLISAGASLLLILIIFVQDGFGGSGRRAAVLQIFAAPDDRSACLTQEQVSRTGVLTHRSFAVPAGAFLSHVLMLRSRWTFYDSRYDFRTRFTWGGSRWSGDWFRSRSEQGHFLQAAVPSRSRIERRPAAPDQPPALVSSLEFTLGSLFFVDETGKTWRSSEPVPPGGEVFLEPVPPAECVRFLKEEAALFTSLPAESLRKPLRPNHCYALAQDPASLLIPTHPSIRWRDDHLLLISQPVLRSATSP